MGDRSLHLWAGHATCPAGRYTRLAATAPDAAGASTRRAAGARLSRPRGHDVSDHSAQSDRRPPATPDFDDMTRDIAEVPAVEVIITVAVNLMSAAAVKLG